MNNENEGYQDTSQTMLHVLPCATGHILLGFPVFLERTDEELLLEERHLVLVVSDSCAATFMQEPSLATQ